MVSLEHRDRKKLSQQSAESFRNIKETRKHPMCDCRDKEG